MASRGKQGNSVLHEHIGRLDLAHDKLVPYILPSGTLEALEKNAKCQASGYEIYGHLRRGYFMPYVLIIRS